MLFWLTWSHFTELCNKTWQIYRVSPLFGMKYEDSFLKSWSKVIKSDFESAKEAAMETSSLKEYQTVSVQVEMFAGLRGDKEDDQAIKIEVSTRRGHTKLVTAFLIGVHSYEQVRMKLKKCISNKRSTLTDYLDTIGKGSASDFSPSHVDVGLFGLCGSPDQKHKKSLRLCCRQSSLVM